jgi:hypothetical protein
VGTDLICAFWRVAFTGGMLKAIKAQRRIGGRHGMRFRSVAAGIAATLLLMPGKAAAQTPFGMPSCVATLVSGPASAFRRFIPSEATGPTGLQIRGIVARSLTWRPGQTLRVCFKSGSPGAHARVIRVAREWMEHANIAFDFEENGAPRRCAPDGRDDIKIDFIDFNGWWSAYGIISRQRDPSMNLQFFGTDRPTFGNGQPVPEEEMRRTILHEFGHALGMLHEHQSPAAGCDQEIDWQAAYNMGSGMGWDREQVHAQMRAFTEIAEFNMTQVDRKSIMHYSLPPNLFRDGSGSKCWVPQNDDLSEQDRRFIAAIYPKSGPPVYTSSLPGAPPVGAVARGRPAAGSDKQALLTQYEALLREAGLPAARIKAMTEEFSKTVMAP